jgi:uncharacterized protein YggE
MATVSLRRIIWILLALALLASAGVFGLTRGGPSAVRAESTTSNDTVSVTGVGTADGRPDTLSADFRVHVTRSSVSDAINAEASAAHDLLDALEKAGVEHKDLRTTDLAIDQHYDNHGNVDGYDASETIRAEMSPLSGVGRMIKAGATASGNDVEVGSLSFDIADDGALVDQARTNAFNDAKARAAQYAELAGRSLGRVERITERIDRPAPDVYYGRQAYDLAAKSGAAVPLRKGTQTLTVRVSVIWSLS